MSKRKSAFGLFCAVIMASSLAVNCFADGEAISVGNNSSPCAEILMEATTGQVLSEGSARTKIHTGSLVKLMSVLLVAEEIEKGTITEETVVTAGKNAFSANGAVIWLETGEKMSVGDLLKGVIIGNANDASIALAEHLCTSEQKFTQRMNKRATELGMLNTKFSDCTGTGAGEQYSTAYDMAILSRELVSHDILLKYMGTYMDELREGETELVNVNTLIRTYKGAIGLKSGYSGETGYSLVGAAQRDEGTYIAVVIGYEDKDSCTARTKALLDAAFSGYELRSPPVPQELMSPVSVRGGVSRSVLAYPEGLTDIVIPKGTAERISYEIEIPEYLEAPVLEKQKIGEIRYLLDGKEIYRTNVLVSLEVKKMNVWSALCKLLKSMLSF